MANNNNNTNKSILEVFGEKSKDGDDLKGLLNSLINPNKVRRGYGLPDVYHGYMKDGEYDEYPQSGGAFVEGGARDILSGRAEPDDEFSNIGDIVSWIEELQSWKGAQKVQEPPRMQPMEKGKGLMALLQRLLPGGRTGMK
jgi:hypothetical protein